MRSVSAYSKVDGILYETHGEGLNKETLISKMEKNNISDVTIQFELKEKFYETETYQGIKSNRDSYLNHYDYLQDLRDACNEFYRSQIKNMGQDFNFSHDDYYSSFYDISEHVFKNEHPYNALKKITEIDKIENVIVSEKHEDVADGWFGSFYDETVKTINAVKSITKDSRLLTGEGIKVGVSEVEMESVKINCANHSNFTLDPSLGSGGNSCESHAHFVLSAITSMAPDVQLYGADSTNSGINWLIQQNVSIINCSWGSEANLGQYCSREKYFDTLALDNDVIFVFSAGNTSSINTDNQLTCPKSAYNIITVGATDSDGQQVASYSCYKTSANIGKPNLIANGTPHLLGSGVGNTFHLDQGTSYAAPLVTGAIAILQNGSAALDFIAASATLAAAANMNRITNPEGSNYAGFDKKAGAGMLDLDRALFYTTEVRFANFSVPSNKIVEEVDIWLYSGLPLKVCASWFAQPVDGQLLPTITNYDLRLLDSTGNVVASSSSSNNNQELLMFTPSVEGSYKIQLYMSSPSLDHFIDTGTISYSYDFDSYYG